MSYKITDECISCGACEPECPNSAIIEGETITSLDDLKDIIDIVWGAKKTGAIYLGGGTPKNYIQQALQFSKGADYGVQITTDQQEFGGSSGALLKEGLSWGKLKYRARFVSLNCDVTIALPLIYSYLKEG